MKRTFGMIEMVVDYRRLTNNELRQILRDRGLPVSGNKDELVRRVVKGYRSLTIPELHRILKRRGLEYSGKKNELVNRLLSYDRLSSNEGGMNPASGNPTNHSVGDSFSNELEILGIRRAYLENELSTLNQIIENTLLQLPNLESEFEDPFPTIPEIQSEIKDLDAKLRSGVNRTLLIAIFTSILILYVGFFIAQNVEDDFVKLCVLAGSIILCPYYFLISFGLFEKRFAKQATERMVFLERIMADIKSYEKKLASSVEVKKTITRQKAQQAIYAAELESIKSVLMERS